MNTAAPETDARVPLDEVMLAMDVVDTLRHQRAQVESELNEEQREKKLIARIQSIYESQGMDVSADVIAAGVQALVEDRFVYEPPRRTLAVRIAEIYVERGKWALRTFLVALVALAVWLAFAIPAHYKRRSMVDEFRLDLSQLRRQVGRLDGQAQGIARALTGAKEGVSMTPATPTGAPTATAATAAILATAERSLTAAREDLQSVRRALEPGPDPESYPGDATKWDGELSGHREVLSRVQRNLGVVDGQVAAIASLRSIRTLASQAVARLEGFDVSPADRRDVAQLAAAVIAAADTGEVETAEQQFRALDARVDSILEAIRQHERHASELARLSARLAGVELDEAPKEEFAELVAGVEQALRSGDGAAAQRDLRRLATLVAELDRSYELRIVAGGNQQSGVWRYPGGRRDKRNYYILVEAIGKDGRPLSLPITSEETRRTKRVKVFGVRVPESVYEAVKQDKLDNGIVDRRKFGTKRRGALVPDYEFEVNGGMITRW